jgi:hypothetical protein
MNVHMTTQKLLYDFLCGDLREEDRTAVAGHLEECAACREECEGLREALQLLPAGEEQPSSSLPQIFWEETLAAVNQKITPKHQGQTLWQQVSDWLTMAVVPHRRLVLGLVSLGIVTVSAFVTWSILRQAPESLGVTEAVQPEQQDPLQETRMGSYFRRSRMLLVGVANMPSAEGQSVDLSLERETSRNLVNEARALKQQALDERSIRLISDLEKIQIELANMDARNDLPTMELVRSGIERENLLFKIRIEETINPQVSYVENR